MTLEKHTGFTVRKKTFEEKHVLAMRPSINLAKNITRRDPVFALMNREVIKGMTS